MRRAAGGRRAVGVGEGELRDRRVVEDQAGVAVAGGLRAVADRREARRTRAEGAAVDRAVIEADGRHRRAARAEAKDVGHLIGVPAAVGGPAVEVVEGKHQARHRLGEEDRHRNGAAGDEVARRVVEVRDDLQSRFAQDAAVRIDGRAAAVRADRRAGRIGGGEIRVVAELDADRVAVDRGEVGLLDGLGRSGCVGRVQAAPDQGVGVGPIYESDQAEQDDRAGGGDQGTRTGRRRRHVGERWLTVGMMRWNAVPRQCGEDPISRVGWTRQRRCLSRCSNRRVAPTFSRRPAARCRVPARRSTRGIPPATSGTPPFARAARVSPNRRTARAHGPSPRPWRG